MPGWTIVRRDAVESTMDELNALADAGAPGGTVVIARSQTAGRGRAGRTWMSAPDSGLFLSALHRTDLPIPRLGPLPLLVGVAVAEAIEALGGPICRLKWPNDVLAPGGKIAGVLIASRSDGERARFVNIGIGVNSFASRDELPAGAASIFSETGRRVAPDELLAPLLACLTNALDHFERSAGKPDLGRWLARAAFVNDIVTVVDAGSTRTGRFVGVDPDGALVLESPSGERRRIVSGDLTRGPRPADA